MKRLIILPVIVAALAGAACTVPDETQPGQVKTLSGNTENKPQDDVELVTCADGEFLPDITVKITNHSSKRSNYSVSVNLLDSAGTKVGDGIAFANNIEPGQSAIEDLLATTNGDFATCQLMEVQRYAS